MESWVGTKNIFFCRLQIHLPFSKSKKDLNITEILMSGILSNNLSINHSMLISRSWSIILITIKLESDYFVYLLADLGLLY
jgi:hypothetical protein